MTEINTYLKSQPYTQTTSFTSVKHQLDLDQFESILIHLSLKDFYKVDFVLENEETSNEPLLVSYFNLSDEAIRKKYLQNYFKHFYKIPRVEESVFPTSESDIYSFEDFLDVLRYKKKDKKEPVPGTSSQNDTLPTPQKRSPDCYRERLRTKKFKASPHNPHKTFTNTSQLKRRAFETTLDETKKKKCPDPGKT